MYLPDFRARHFLWLEFDIADFKAFTKELIERPQHLYTDFIIFGYTMDEATGDVVIKRVWLKKMWEIVRPMDGWPITLQYKNKQVHKIRPGNWNSKKSKFKLFATAEDFLAAFEQTVWQNPDTKDRYGTWRNSFLKSYQKHFGRTITIPKWEDIEKLYKQ